MSAARIDSGRITLGSLFRAIWKILKIVLILLLIVLLVGVGALGVWARGSVQTGAGELSRYEAARVYLYLMEQQEPWPCYWTFVTVPITGVVGWAIQDIGAAARGGISWKEVPGAFWEQMAELLAEVLHTHAGSCRIPSPDEWSPALAAQALRS